MSAEEAADKTTPADASAGDAGEAGDEEEEWLYGDDDEKAEEEEAKLTAAVSAPAPESDEAVTTGNGVEAQVRPLLQSVPKGTLFPCSALLLTGVVHYKGYRVPFGTDLQCFSYRCMCEAG
ncbi:unnamed protein product [Coregonus sp. 'balchen']|nr:unnamed protein product [Coregonus sp. 'balchen']